MSDIKPANPKKEFNDFMHIIETEIEQAQVRLISAANVQLLFHYWKVGHYILFNQKRLGWGSKIIDQIAKEIKKKYPNKKGYSTRNLTYMCQFAKQYPIEILKRTISADAEMCQPTLEQTMSVIRLLNEFEFTQEPLAQIQPEETKAEISKIADVENTLTVITQEPLAQLENLFKSSPIGAVNWASHVILMNNKLSLGIRY